MSPKFVGRKCTVRLYDERLEVVIDAQVVACHTRRMQPGGRHVLREHEEEFKRRTPSRHLLEQAFLRLGQAAESYHQGLIAERDVFLVLAADRDGMSLYHQDRICSTLEVDLDDYLEARNGLLAKDLVAFDGRRFQVLSLPQAPVWSPSRPLTTPQQLESDDPATVRQLIRDSLAEAKPRR